MQDFEKLGAFYLGRRYDPSESRITDDLTLYQAKDLTTHAVCVGMTGSGKTGLGIGLLEEAAIDGIPAIVIDPKGDMGNLLLTFPALKPSDFQPWIDPSEAARDGQTVVGYAAKIAARWTKGLAQWGQEPSRIQRFRNAVDLALYTPGSTAGRPIRVLQSLSAPPAAIIEDSEAFRDRLLGVSSGLLTLLGIDPDPVRSREMILITTLLDHAWRAGRDLTLADLVREIQAPPIEKVGVLDLESFYPQRERFELAMQLNNLLASPGFAVWMEGEPLDIQSLLYSPSGKPRVSILSIAHLSENERMFFVTMLLNELVTWTRAQAGTSSLRALLYMDEVFGYMPPTANPPSKRPLLTLFKQARAYGVGVVLATQNPVDLDYKALSNAGTWFLGRLQTERDKARVLDGLEAASSSTGARFNRTEMDHMLSGLDSRVFLLHNVHDDGPELFQTRWVLSYLAGPLTRKQINSLTDQAPKTLMSESGPVERAGAAESKAADRPLLPPEIEERFAPVLTAPGEGSSLVYRPTLVGSARLHYVNSSANVDRWENVQLVALLGGDSPWDRASKLDDAIELLDEPERSGKFSAIPGPVTSKSAKSWAGALESYLYRERPLVLKRCKTLKATSRPEQANGEFEAELQQQLREKRDIEVEKLRKRYAPKLKRIQERIVKAEHKVERETEQKKQQGFQTAISLGATVLGALFGRKTRSVGTVGRAATTLSRAGRAQKEKQDVARAEESLSLLQEDLAALEEEFQSALEDRSDDFVLEDLEIDDLVVRARKSDIEAGRIYVVWTPWAHEPSGELKRLF